MSIRGLAALPCLLAVAGCVSTTASVQPVTTASTGQAAPNTSAATWQMPWQLTRGAAPPSGEPDEVTLAYVPQTGYVRATPRTLASLGQPLRPALGPNRTVDACRTVVQSEAAKLGAKEVEAVSRGPHQVARGGHLVGSVDMRITYAVPGGYEVREATMTCIVDRNGAIVDAFA
jgi:hypothetical protein